MYIDYADNPHKSAGIGCCGKGLGTIDVTTFTAEDWFLIGVIGALIYGFANSGSGGGSSSSFKPAPKRKAKKRSKGGTATLEAILITAVALGAGYVGYQYYASQQGSASS